MTAISLKKKKMQYVYANKFDKKKTIFFFNKYRYYRAKQDKL